MSGFDPSYFGGPDDSTLAYRQQQRRKVNTCLQCKTRKVKCDKVRPHCGPCKRRRIPVERCNWAEETDPETFQQAAAAASVGGFSHHHAGGAGRESSDWSSPAFEPAPSPAPLPLPQEPTTPVAPGSTLLGLSDTDARTVLERISRLEMRMRGSEPDFGSPTPSAVDAAAGSPLVSAQGRQIDAAALAGAAHARAVHSANAAAAGPSASSTTARSSAPPQSAEVISLIDDDDDDGGLDVAAVDRLPGTTPIDGGAPFPFASTATKDKIELIVGSLPNDHAINTLLDGFRTYERLVPLGISWRLFRNQLIGLRGDIAEWRNGFVEDLGVDLSFLALLFEVMAAAAECRPAEDLVRQGIATGVDAVSDLIEQWHDTCKALLGMGDLLEQPNLNTLNALSLFGVHAANRGKVGSSSVYARMCLTLARKLGLHALGTAELDRQRWQSRPEDDDTTVRTGPIAAVRKAQFQDDTEYQAAEEADLLRQLLSSTDDGIVPRREDDMLEAVLPDRSHLVRESARMLWAQLRWQSAMCGDWAAVEGETSRVTLGVEEAELADGESLDVPASSFEGTADGVDQTRTTTSNLALHRDIDQMLGVVAASAAPGGGRATLTPHEIQKMLEDLASCHPPTRSEAGLPDRVKAHDSLRLLTASWLGLRATRPFLRTSDPVAQLAVKSARAVLRAAEALRGVAAASTKPLAPWFDVALLQAGLVLAVHRLVHIERGLAQDVAALKSELDAALALVATSSDAPDEHDEGDDDGDPGSKSPRNGARLLTALAALVEQRQREWAKCGPKVKSEDGDDGNAAMDVDPPANAAASRDDDAAPAGRAQSEAQVQENEAATSLSEHDPVRPYFEELRKMRPGAAERQVVDLPGFWRLLEGVS
ncbi:uncharacterized protein PFL1_05231 [Pseudozyma flocculosa PF-1]|uniref:Zn(2)-C6 fungal-type domain-containing protein n=2 Tax=Pseudozyma flocculosa TaxID=84751 RepID=A0A5C3F8G1_9BASI|nr:uncharacterized protein PFL1_05231 [Pseudozyma flocculosa PF-1]EPQ27309.1 hypothetical protein PFL1_05231 [Pseudozyma flocculosa PF-1]SPO39679.1 uncharacterized protein PSFLO_05160 [Pseudozyma flocculosa]